MFRMRNKLGVLMCSFERPCHWEMKKKLDLEKLH